MAASMRSEVLRCFKQLHRTRRKVFLNDEVALEAGRRKINEEFLKNRNLRNPTAITELVKFGHQVEEILRTSIIQAKQKEQNVFEIKITEDIAMFDNVPFRDPDAGQPQSRKST